jgi:hypothetical protein
MSRQHDGSAPNENRADSTPATSAPAASTPADDLGELWQALDTLPQAEPPEDLLATTIEMVAVRAGTASRHGFHRGQRLAGFRRELWQWLAPAATVLAAIVGGFWLGHVTSPQPQLPRAGEIDWRSRREEMMKQTIRETIENSPAAKQFMKKQLREAAEGQGRPPVRPPKEQPSKRLLGQPPAKRFEGPNRPRPEDGRRLPPAAPENRVGPRRKFPEPPRERGGPRPEPPAAVPGEGRPPLPPSPPAV